MEIHFFIDPETGEPHIYGHQVDEGEVEEVLLQPGEDLPARNNARSIIGQTDEGRFLRLIVVRESEGKQYLGSDGLRAVPSTARSLQAAAPQEDVMVDQKLPPGWTAEKVKALADYYDNQSDEEAIAEIEAATAAEGQTLVMVPTELLPVINKLIAKHQHHEDGDAR